MGQFTPEDRRKIISDIASWRDELDVDDGLSDDDLVQFVNVLQSLPDDDLERRWHESVGEWILSRDDVIAAHEDDDGLAPDGDEICEDELERLLDDSRDTTYGYLGGRVAIPSDA